MKVGPVRCLFVGLCLWAFALPVHAANLLVEGGNFEAGFDGIGITPVVLVRNWPRYVAPSIDSTTAGEGSRSLKLVNGSGEDVFALRSRAFHLEKPQGEVSVSFFARTDTAGAQVIAGVCSGPQPIVEQTFEIGSEWKRYQFTLAPRRWTGQSDSNRTSVAGTYYLRLITPALKPWKTIWLDGIQVEMGPVTPYAAPEPTSLAFSIDRQIAVYHLEEIPQIVLHAASKGIAGQSVKVQLEELISGTKEPAQELVLLADGDANHGQATIPLSPRPRGCYRITASTADGKYIQSRGYGVIVSLADRPHDQRAFFGGSIETYQSARGLAAEYGIPVGPADSLIGSHYSPDALFGLARDLGWGWWHAYWPYSPKVLEPDGKEFLWQDADLLTDAARRNDLEIMANLCAHGSSRQLPDWMKGNQIGLGGMTIGKGDHLLDPQKYKAYAQAVVEHFKDRIKLWEPWNEPSVKLRAEEYLPLLKAAYTGIKAADPTATVYGLCGTWDVSGDLYGWVKSCLKLGAGDYMDKISIHGYHVPERRYAAKVKQLAKEITGRDWAVADTEAGPFVTFQVYPQLVDAMMASPKVTLDDSIASMPQLYINELSNGVERGSWFNLTSYYAGINYRDLVMLEYDGAPTPAMIAYNTLIDLLGPSKHFRSVPMGGDVAIEVFIDSNGHPLATLWADKLPQTVQIPIAAGMTQVVDLRGQSQTPAAQGDGIELNLGRRPIFLRTSNLSADQLVTALSKSVVVGLEDLQITRAGLSRDPNGQPAIAVVLKGKTSQPTDGNLTVSKSPWALSSTTQIFSPIPLDESKTIYFPLNGVPGVSSDATIGLAVKLDNAKSLARTWPLKIWSSARAVTPVTLDGDLSKWDPSQYRQLSNWARAASRWDDNGVYFALRCQDNTPQQHVSIASPWKSDSVELYFNPSVDHSFEDGSFYPGDAQVTCPVPGLQDSSTNVSTAYHGQPPGSDLNKSPRMVPENVRMATKRFDGGYTMEIFVPWKNFPEGFAAHSGNFLGFSIAVRDVDSNGGELRRIIWAGDDGDYKDTSGYGSLLLVP